jgi:excisionase family DNA binding protein
MNNLKNCPLLTTVEIAFVLKVSPRTVCLWAERSEIPALLVGRQWRFRRDEFNRWLERRARDLCTDRRRLAPRARTTLPITPYLGSLGNFSRMQPHWFGQGS